MESVQQQFSMDLASLARFHLDFLGFYEQNEHLIDEPVAVKRAVYRYERLWLPFYSAACSSGEISYDLYPPFDVAWVWQCHLLSYLSYRKNCAKVLNSSTTFLDHYCFELKWIRAKQEYTKSILSRIVSQQGLSEETSNLFSEQEADKAAPNFESRIEYDLLAASERQKRFLYQVSLPHFRTREFLNTCLDQYKQFVNTSRSTSNEINIQTCVGLRLIWQTHRMSPRVYSKEARHLISLDDSVFDFACGPTSDEFKRSGAMYRGEHPRVSRLFSDLDLTSRIFEHRGAFGLVSVSLMTHEKKQFRIRLLTDKNKCTHKLELNAKMFTKEFKAELKKRPSRYFRVVDGAIEFAVELERSVFSAGRVCYFDHKARVVYKLERPLKHDDQLQVVKIEFMTGKRSEGENKESSLLLRWEYNDNLNFKIRKRKSN
jgi:hypothetical protein